MCDTCGCRLNRAVGVFTRDGCRVCGECAGVHDTAKRNPWAVKMVAVVFMLAGKMRLSDPWMLWARRKALCVNTGFDARTPAGERVERTAETWWGVAELLRWRLARREREYRRTDWRKCMKRRSQNISSRRGGVGGVTPTDLLELLERQAYRCAITSDELTVDNVAADHIVPVSRGGDNSIHNIQLVTKQANRMKGTMTMPELRELCLSVIKTAGSDIDDTSS